jgi:hypothetical protein
MYGSETAAPVFQKIAERAANYLAIPAEQIPDQTVAIKSTTQTAKNYATP